MRRLAAPLLAACLCATVATLLFVPSSLRPASREARASAGRGSWRPNRRSVRSLATLC